MRRKKTRVSSVITLIILIALIVGGGILGYLWWNELGPFHKPGQVIYGASVPEAQRALIEQAFGQLEAELSKNVKVESSTELSRQDDIYNILYDVRVPVADFYGTELALSSNEIAGISAGEQAVTEGEGVEPAQGIQMISVLELTPAHRLLAIDNEYYLDTFDSGALFDYLTFEGVEEDVVKITTLLQPSLPQFPDAETTLTLAQTGVTALSRGMNAKLDQVGNAAYFAEKIAPFLSQFDLTHTSNEASFSNQANSTNICSKAAMIDVLTTAGIDIIELTGNHNQDCGNEAAVETIKQYQALNLQTFGGGENATAATAPLNISQKGNNITLLGYNLSTGGYTLGDTPGANFYTEEKAVADITAAKERGDIVIVDVQYYECNSYDTSYENTTCDYANSAAGDQIGLFRHLIDLGADVVVGTAAHQPQTYERYGDGEIYYGLGNLFFDQIWWPGTTRSLVLVHYFFDGELIQTRIVPTVYGASMQTELMDSADATSFLKRLISARP